MGGLAVGGCGQVQSGPRPPCPDSGSVLAMIDWSAVPVVEVPLRRFVIPLHGIDLRYLRLSSMIDVPGYDSLVLAFTRWPEHGSVEVSDGRHRVLRALLRGEAAVPTRLVVIP